MAARQTGHPPKRVLQGQGGQGATEGGVVPSTGGRPLDSVVRADMEQAFRHDFSRVRVHSGDEASSMARSLTARAYCYGHDIVFGHGESVLGPAGRRLLAHELAHVVQYDVSGRAVIARQTGPPPPLPPAASAPV
ncbi:eCIS core domain-containing protein [Streptomyces sp. KLMMK]|uniref:eCIS core domain-containing protein n=1 Tax=Streptomyces sp. KLMMK TaxID=3109353 RepID=UPI003FA7EDDF